MKKGKMGYIITCLMIFLIIAAIVTAVVVPLTLNNQNSSTSSSNPTTPATSSSTATPKPVPTSTSSEPTNKFEITLLETTNGEIFAEKETDISYGEKVTITFKPIKGYVLSKYIVDGDSKDPSGAENGVEWKYQITVKGDVQIGATFVAGTYTFTFRSNDSDKSFSGESSIDVTYGRNPSLPTSTTTGFDVNWTTDGENSFSWTEWTEDPKDMTLIAVWVGRPVKVIYYADGSSTIIENTYTSYGGSFENLTTTEPVKDGYYCTGWVINNTVVSITDGTNWTYFKNSVNLDATTNELTLTLSAVWTEMQVQIYYDDNYEGAKWTGNASFSRVNNYTVEYTNDRANPNELTPSDKPSPKYADRYRYGYDFVGWNTKADGTGQNYGLTDKWYWSEMLSKLTVNTVTKAGVKIKYYQITFYANWEELKYQVIYNLNGGDGTAPSAITSVGAVTGKWSVTTETPVRSGHIFAGWNTMQDGTGTTYIAGSQQTGLPTAADLNLYASWISQSDEIITVTYDKNGGTGDVGNTYTPYGSKFANLIGYEPTRSGYKFIGWYTDADQGSNNIIGGKVWEAFSSYVTGLSGSYALTLYAHWLSDTDAKNGKEIGTYPQTKVTDIALIESLKSKAGTLPTENTDGSTNNGWTSYDYYVSSSDLTNYMWYKDINGDDGEKYRGVYFTNYRPSMTTSSFPDETSAHQYKSGYSKENIYWFKWEPIKWKVLDSSSGLVISEELLDAQHYFRKTGKATRTDYEDNDLASVLPSDYKYSDVRGWLNTTFYSSSFSDSEKQNTVKKVTVDNSKATLNLEGTVNPALTYANTNDNVFLPSYSEIYNDYYFEFTSSANTIRTSQTSATDYAKCQGIIYNKSNTTSYWTRSPVLKSKNGTSSLYVTSNGTITNNSSSNGIYFSHFGIRPAICI